MYMCARSQVTKKLQAGRKRCSSVGWTQQAEIDLLCDRATRRFRLEGRRATRRLKDARRFRLEGRAAI